MVMMVSVVMIMTAMQVVALVRGAEVAMMVVAV